MLIGRLTPIKLQRACQFVKEPEKTHARVKRQSSEIKAHDSHKELGLYT